MSRYQILVADDDENARAALVDYLSLSGYGVSEAANGLEAIEKTRRLRPDLLLLDVQMPGTDGFEALTTLREDPTFAEVPILLVTSLSRANLKVKALDLGADDYLVKPFDRTELVARVRRALRRSARYRDISSALSGDLSHVSLPELLQTIELGRRTARVTFPDHGAELVVERGRLCRAHLGNLEGLEVVRRLLLCPRGPFRVAFQEPPELTGETPAGVSLQEALLECTRELDEATRFLPGSVTWETVVEIVEPRSPLLARGANPGALTVGELVARVDTDLQTAARSVADALRTGAVRLAPPAP